MKTNFLTRICLIWGVFWGILGFIIYFEGLLSWWYPSVLIVTAILLILIFIWFIRFKKNEPKKFFISLYQTLKKDKILTLLVILFVLMILFNLIGALAPEKEFDSLWYHLTLPKIWLQAHHVFFVHGGLFYYSAMPKLAEMLYGFTLTISQNGILAKLLHFAFGIFWAILSYEILREFFSKKLSLLLTLVIYNLYLVSWLSSTAYIDLIVAFFVAGALWSLIRYLKEEDTSYIYIMGLFMGFALSTKTYSLMMLAAISLILIMKKDYRSFLKFIIISFLISFPFYLFSFLATGNPIYPIFSLTDISFPLWVYPALTYKGWLLKVWPIKLPGLLWRMLSYQFTPIFGLLLLLPFYLKKKENLLILLSIFLVFFFILWSFLPVWEPRYFFVILPVVAVLVGFILTKIRFRAFQIAVGLLILVSVVYNGYLGYLFQKEAFPVVFGKESRNIYLEKNVAGTWFSFYDGGGYLQQTFSSEDKLLTVNYHNLFYVPVKFTDWSTMDDNSYFQSAAILSAKLKENQITYIAITQQDLSQWSGLKSQDLEQYFESVHQKGFSRVYKIK